jgi:hypothetical protein
MKSDKNFYYWAMTRTNLTISQIHEILDFVHYREDVAFEDGISYGAAPLKLPSYGFIKTEKGDF